MKLGVYRRFPTSFDWDTSHILLIFAVDDFIIGLDLIPDVIY
jgi:hypothetical protein